MLNPLTDYTPQQIAATADRVSKMLETSAAPPDSYNDLVIAVAALGADWDNTCTWNDVPSEILELIRDVHYAS